MPENSNESFDNSVRPVTNEVDSVRTTRYIQESLARGSQSWTQNGPMWNPVLDEYWAGVPKEKSWVKPSNYFDYFFSGQDIKVIMEGADLEIPYSDIPIAQIAWSINQKKTPVYGFWSYTWDHCAVGTRMVAGNLVIPTKYVGYFRDCIKAAARSRKHAVYPYNRPLTQDDSNVEKYWHNNIDPFNSNAEPNIYSAHPSFNLQIIYGIQNVSLSTISSTAKAQELFKIYEESNPFYTDTNERLVESDSIEHKNRIVLDSCQIMGMATTVNPSGEPILEQYSFIARDMIEV